MLNTNDNGRKFGAEIENISANTYNHIVLKSRAFSFENNNKIYAENRSKNVQRRTTISYENKPYLLKNHKSIKIYSQKQFLQIKQQKNLSECLSRIEDSSQVQISYKYMDKIRQNIQAVPEYIQNCMKFMQQRSKLKIIKIQNMQKANPQYLIKRSDIIDQLSGIHYRLGLSLQTLSIAVSYMDKFLSQVTIDEKQYKLISIIALFLASKFQQIYCEKLPIFLQIAKLKLQKSKVQQIESQIINVLSFELVYDSPVKFIQLYALISQLSHKNQCIAQYFVQLAMTNSKYVQFEADLLAAAAVYAVHRLRKVCPTWPIQLQQITGYKEQDLLQCVRLFSSIIESNNQNIGDNIRYKYSKDEYCQVSNIKLYRAIQ